MSYFKYQGICESNKGMLSSVMGIALPFFRAPLQIPEVLHLSNLTQNNYHITQNLPIN